MIQVCHPENPAILSKVKKPSTTEIVDGFGELFGLACG